MARIGRYLVSSKVPPKKVTSLNVGMVCSLLHPQVEQYRYSVYVCGVNEQEKIVRSCLRFLFLTFCLCQGQSE